MENTGNLDLILGVAREELRPYVIRQFGTSVRDFCAKKGFALKSSSNSNTLAGTNGTSSLKCDWSEDSRPTALLSRFNSEIIRFRLHCDELSLTVFVKVFLPDIGDKTQSTTEPTQVRGADVRAIIGLLKSGKIVWNEDDLLTVEDATDGALRMICPVDLELPGSMVTAHQKVLNIDTCLEKTEMIAMAGRIHGRQIEVTVKILPTCATKKIVRAADENN